MLVIGCAGTKAGTWFAKSPAFVQSGGGTNGPVVISPNPAIGQVGSVLGPYGTFGATGLSAILAAYAAYANKKTASQLADHIDETVPPTKS